MNTGNKVGIPQKTARIRKKHGADGMNRNVILLFRIQTSCKDRTLQEGPAGYRQYETRIGYRHGPGIGIARREG